jgi:hypothetical protein
VTLDTSGRLLQYERLPDAADAPSGGEVDWRLLFERAGLSPAAFTSIAPRELPLGHSDVRVAWSGRHPRRPEIPLRIEAASLGGRPVSFHVVHPWEVEQAAPAGDQEGALLAVLLSLYFGAITLAVFLAWKNYRIGRGDRRGTLRLMLFVFGSRLLYWIVAAHHAGSAGEAERFVAGLQSALYWAALLGLLYLALEPFVRKRWPEWTISWSRLLAGKATDPLVGRDLLAGGVLGMGLVVTCYVHSILPLVLGSGGVPPSTHSTVLLQFGFFGFRGFLALLITQMSGSLLFSFIVVAVVLFFAMLTRHRGAALVITFAVLYLAFSMNFGARSLPQYLVSVIMPMIFIIALSRFGLLTLVTALFYMHLWPFYPATSSVTEWHALPYVLDVLLLLVIAMYALRIATAGEPMLRREFLE